LKRRLAILTIAAAAAVLATPARAAERKAPEFELKLLDGSSLHAKDLLGSVTVIDFWATWCQPCLDEIPDYNRLFRAYGSKIRFVGVATDSGTEKEVKLAVKELKISYPVAAPTLKELDVFGDILIFPTTWVIDSEGRIVQEFLGVPPGKHEQLRGLVDKLLAQIPKR
jgi:thiol-disulfide isomerase/thioredoxin